MMGAALRGTTSKMVMTNPTAWDPNSAITPDAFTTRMRIDTRGAGPVRLGMVSVERASPGRGLTGVPSTTPAGRF